MIIDLSADDDDDEVVVQPVVEDEFSRLLRQSRMVWVCKECTFLNDDGLLTSCSLCSGARNTSSSSSSSSSNPSNNNPHTTTETRTKSRTWTATGPGSGQARVSVPPSRSGSVGGLAVPAGGGFHGAGVRGRCAGSGTSCYHNSSSISDSSRSRWWWWHRQ